MFLQELELDSQTTVAEIVRKDYRTAEVFSKYGIEYCCGAKWPLATICIMKGIEENVLIKELEKAARTILLPTTLSFENWSVDFLVDYIINIHHYYLEKKLPDLEIALTDFVLDHSKKYPYLNTLLSHFGKFHSECLLHLKYEEEVIFPYIRQIAHAFTKKESFAHQLVRILRKPVGKMIDQDLELFVNNFPVFRELTNNYTPPVNACTNHHVILAKLKELDYDMAQHIYLENDILFPKIINMEKELLAEDSF